MKRYLILCLVFAVLFGNGCSSLSPTIPVASVDGVETPQFPQTEEDAIRYYFGDRKLDLVEGIWTWDNNFYQVAIIRNNTGIHEQVDMIIIR